MKISDCSRGREKLMPDHIPVSRIREISESVTPETGEIEHLVNCMACFALMQAFLDDRRFRPQNTERA